MPDQNINLGSVPIADRTSWAIDNHGNYALLLLDAHGKPIALAVHDFVGWQMTFQNLRRVEILERRKRK